MKKLSLILAISFFFSFVTYSQVQYAAFEYPEFKVLEDTLNYTDTLTFSFRIFHHGCAIGPCNTFNDSLDFWVGLETYHTYPLGVSLDNVFGGLQIMNPYDSSPLYLPDGDTTGTVFIKIPLNQSVQLSGKVGYTFWADSHLPYYSRYWNSDTIWTGSGSSRNYLYITNPNCQANFQILPSSTQGSYFGYNISTGNNLTYLWNFGDGDTSSLPYPVHNYAVPGEYEVCLYAYNTAMQCHSSYCDKSFYVFKTEDGLMDRLEILATSVNEVEPVGIDIYPNPVADILNCKTPTKDITQIAIYNLSGIKVVEQKFSPQVNVSDLPAGIYTFELSNATQKARSKFIKQ